MTSLVMRSTARSRRSASVITTFLSPSSWHNAALTGSEATASTSAAEVQDLIDLINKTGPWVSDAAVTSGLALNAGNFSVPVYEVSAGETLRNMTLVNSFTDHTAKSNPNLLAAMQSVPITTQARSADPMTSAIEARRSSGSNGDGHICFWQRSSNTYWEMYCFHWSDGTYSTPPIYFVYGGRIQSVSSKSGFVNNGSSESIDWGSTASSIPVLAGLIRTTELEAGLIPHAIVLAIPKQKGSANWVFPAQRTDDAGNTTYFGGQIPMGRRFRLPNNGTVNTAIAAMGNTAGRAIATAVRDYGLYVRDHSNNCALYVEDWKNQPRFGGPGSATNPYTSGSWAWNGQNATLTSTGATGAVLTGFPFTSLIALDPPAS